MKNWMVLSALVVLVAAAGAQPTSPKEPPRKQDPVDTGAARRAEQRTAIQTAELQGIEVRIKDIARFRGVRSNQLFGFGIVVGLAGNGDTKKTPFTATLIANALKDAGTSSDPSTFGLKNVAVVSVTAELPPFAMPGNRINVTVQSIGDAKTLQGGSLLPAPLYPAGNKETAYAVAFGELSIGGFSAEGGGSSVSKNHPTVGIIPDGGFVEASVPTKTVFADGSMYLELNEADFTTAARLAEKLREAVPQYQAFAVDGGSIRLTLPEGMSPVRAMAEIEGQKFFADTVAMIVINERTGTIVVGGNVRIGPAMVAKGSLNVRIDRETIVSQPNTPFTNGQTVVTNQTTVNAGEDTAQVALIAPATTVADLARLFQTLKVSPTDVIAILEALKAQGALKARIKVQ